VTLKSLKVNIYYQELLNLKSIDEKNIKQILKKELFTQSQVQY